MNKDEIELVAAIRPEAPPYADEARQAARRGLAAAAAPRARGRNPLRNGPRWRGPYAMALAGALAVAVGATAITLARAPGGGPSGDVEEVVVTMPKIVAVSASEVLDRAARAAVKRDLAPRDDQFVKVESETMYGAFSGVATNAETGEVGEETRYLYRTRRAIWLSADGTRDGVLRIEHLEPRAYPGWPIPEAAYKEPGVETLPLVNCGKIPEYMRTDHAALKRLPADADGMRAHLYTGDRGGNSKDEAAFTAAGDMLRETYMPPAQRAALFKAVGTIPGVDVTERAEDAAGREGIGVGRVGLDGVRQDLIFDAKTYDLLGERGIVVDEKAAKSPRGSLVASTAQLSVTVADEAPEVEVGDADRCG
ncbi:CU044_5270 family protein [Streptosporangium sp. NPDC006013]|uniref:CU044_5270 family protein n=1 Tax=Streptosporangium sp. NPDC006013 TaxID=3155596 RepID=UPI0033BB0D9C